MTGTSMDGIDVALVKIGGVGLDMTVSLEATHSKPLRSLRKLLRPMAREKRLPAEKFATYAQMLALTHVVAIRDLLKEHGGDVTPDFIAVHGQTVFHQRPVTLQLMDPWPVATEFGVPVVFDFRRADMAMGGEGAPMTPIADFILFRDPDETRCVLNLGGFANYTWLPKTGRQGADALSLVRGGDVCACNQLLDAVARKCFKKRYDKGGEFAMAGDVDEDAIEMLQMMLDMQAEGGRSLGTGDETTNWARTFAHMTSGPDLARTACCAIADTVARRIGEVDRVIVAGGGACNAALMDELSSRIRNIELSDRHGIPFAYREAIAMAMLGALCEDRVPIMLPQVTGCYETVVSGAWARP